jgi:glycosyltransferase involved in cell wall biosynthesis
MLEWRAPVVVTAHSCVLSWWRAVKGCAAPESWNRYRETVTASLRSADVVTAPSRAMADAVAEHYGAADCVVIPNGRSPRRFWRGAKEPFVLTAGRLWDEAKNVGAMAEAAPRIGWPVYVAGESPRRIPNCTMLGRLGPEALAGWYSRAAIYALPARYEPFGLSALEAALSGCALALGDIPSLREVWGGAAVYAGDLGAVMRELIADAEYRESMAEAAYERARQFTPRRMAEQYMDAYAAAASERGRACAS